MAIELFKFFFKNSDLSPKPLNYFHGTTSTPPIEISSFTIYFRIFNGLFELNKGRKLFLHTLQGYREKTPE